MKTDIPYGALEECRFPLVPLGAIAHFTSGWTPSSKNSAFYSGVNKWATIADLNSHYISDTRQRISDVAVREAGHPKLSNPGDLLFSFKLSVGMTSIVSSPMYTNEAIATFRPSRYLDAGFAYYAFPVFLSAAARPNIYGAPLLSASLISRARVPRLSLMDQRRIADYLDDEVREMDALIADLEMLIVNLGDRRGLLITERLQADENDAGGANEVGLWNFAEVNPLTPEFSSLEVGEDLTFLPLENIWPNGRADLSRTLPWDGGKNSYTQFRRGDILVPKVTPTVFHGRTMIADVESLIGLATSEVHVLRAKESALPRWLVYNLRSSRFLQRAQGEIYGVGGLQRISSRFLSGFKVPITSIGRQREIADELDRETAEMDFLIKEATELIENLKARKTALITEVVTGRKKV